MLPVAASANGKRPGLRGWAHGNAHDSTADSGAGERGGADA